MDLYTRLARLGFTMEEADKLRRIEKTLHRWAEHECNGNIQRDEATDKPFWHNSTGRLVPLPIADRERGALRRLEEILLAVNQRLFNAAEMAGENSFKSLWFYHQTDPRGATLYVGRKSDLRPGQDLSGCYSSAGVAVCD